jgi:hypothetical protein
MTTKLNDGEELEVLAVLRTLKQVVEEAGEDYVYQRWFRTPTQAKFPGEPAVACMYVKDGEPDCLAARVLVRLGAVSADALSVYEGRACDMLPNLTNQNADWGAAPSSLAEVQLHAPALRILRSAQAVQDNQGNWGDARDRALFQAFELYGIKVNK